MSDWPCLETDISIHSTLIDGPNIMSLANIQQIYTEVSSILDEEGQILQYTAHQWDYFRMEVLDSEFHKVNLKE